MSRKSFIVAALLLSCFPMVISAQEKKPAATRRVAIRAGHLIDGKSDKPLENALIVIEDDKIVSVAAGGAGPGGGGIVHPSEFPAAPGVFLFFSPSLLKRRGYAGS